MILRYAVGASNRPSKFYRTEGIVKIIGRPHSQHATSRVEHSQGLCSFSYPTGSLGLNPLRGSVKEIILIDFYPAASKTFAGVHVLCRWWPIGYVES